MTTLLDMPLNSVPATTTAPALDIKRTAARSRIAVDLGFIGGVSWEMPKSFRPSRGGVFAFKCFLVPSGVAEFPRSRSATSGLRSRSLPGWVRS